MRIGILGIVAIVAGIVALFHALDLLPPRELTMAAGAPGSAYHAIAVRYRDILAEDGIVLDILETPGSVANAERLADPAAPADLAILQGGVNPLPDGPDIEALAAIFVEPLFVFHRAELGADAHPETWADLRIAAGAEGSGTRAAVLEVMAALGNPVPEDRLLAIGTMDAADRLLAGDLDVAIFVAPITAPYLADLVATPDLRLAQMRDVEALERRLSFVDVVDIPSAGFDYVGRLPPETIYLPAMVARLVARADLHPALVERLIRAAERIHRGGDLLTPEGRFPSTENLAMAVNPQAEAMIAAGPSTISRFLPFWMVAQINRVAVLLLPIVFLLLPLLRALPGLYAWSMHSRVYRHYDELLRIDAEMDGVEAADDLDALRDRLDAIDDEARSIRVSARYREYVYTLRLHIDLVRRRLNARRREIGEPAAA